MSSPTPTAVSTVREAFLDAVRAAEILTAAQLARADSTVPFDVANSAAAARSLVSAGLLTRFQAERLLAGRTDGFHLGPYVIQEQVGRGTVGRVYKAKHRTMNRSVAIKVLSSDLTRTGADREVLQREVRAAAQLNHPHIVTAYDANELGERHYLVLEFVDGPNFETLVRERGPLPVLEACELVRQLALGLAHAHGSAVVHGDLKPTNLLVTRTSVHPGYAVKIADFGMARLAPARSARSQDFAAPEFAHNPLASDHRADLYSLGAVFYFLLAGRPPFVDAEQVHRQFPEAFRIDRLRFDVHPTVAALIHQLLARQPQSRPVSAAEVAERLDGIFGGAGTAINFDLPPANAGPYSFVAGQLSGGYPIPMAEAVPDHAGRRSGTEKNPAAPPPAVAAAWEQITGAHPKVSATPVSSARRKRRTAYSLWGMSGLFGAMLLVSVAAIGLVVKLVAK